MSKIKNVIEVFNDNLDHYLTITSDRYTATQWAAIATEQELGISKDTLIACLSA